MLQLLCPGKYSVVHRKGKLHKRQYRVARWTGACAGPLFHFVRMNAGPFLVYYVWPSFTVAFIISHYSSRFLLVIVLIFQKLSEVFTPSCFNVGSLPSSAYCTYPGLYIGVPFKSDKHCVQWVQMLGICVVCTVITVLSVLWCMLSMSEVVVETVIIFTWLWVVHPVGSRFNVVACSGGLK